MSMSFNVRRTMRSTSARVAPLNMPHSAIGLTSKSRRAMVAPTDEYLQRLGPSLTSIFYDYVADAIKKDEEFEGDGSRQV